jgi:hypothetical protein
MASGGKVASVCVRCGVYVRFDDPLRAQYAFLQEHQRCVAYDGIGIVQVNAQALHVLITVTSCRLSWDPLSLLAQSEERRDGGD